MLKKDLAAQKTGKFLLLYMDKYGMLLSRNRGDNDRTI